MHTDSEIRRDVEIEREWDRDINAKNISVQLEDGTVALARGAHHG